MGECGLGPCGSEQGPEVGCCEHGNEHSVYIKGCDLLNCLTDN
jgi:hypothetical protein